MRYCAKCRKAIHPRAETYHGLCGDCYKEYLFEMIEEMKEDESEPEKKEKKTNSFLDFIKKFFKKT